MKIQVKPIGYKFRVTNSEGVFDIESTTELNMTKSEEIIRKFFDNFVIRKSDIRVSSEEITTGAKPAVKNRSKSAVENGANSTMKNIMRSKGRMTRQAVVRSTERSVRTIRRNVEKKPVRSEEKNIEKVADKKRVKPAVELANNKRETLQDKWKKLGRTLNDEFTLQEYIKSLRDAGYEYTILSWEAVPSQQISRLIELGEVEKIGENKPYKFRKINVSTKAKSEKSREILKI